MLDRTVEALMYMKTLLYGKWHRALLVQYMEVSIDQRNAPLNGFTMRNLNGASSTVLQPGAPTRSRRSSAVSFLPWAFDPQTRVHTSIANIRAAFESNVVPTITTVTGGIRMNRLDQLGTCIPVILVQPYAIGCVECKKVYFTVQRINVRNVVCRREDDSLLTTD